MEVLRSGITGITPQRYGISNGLGASLYRCVAWLEAVPSGSERELHRGGGSIFDQDHQLLAGDDVTNPHRMPDDRQAVIDVQNAIKKRGCEAQLMRPGTPSRPIWTQMPGPGGTLSRALHICFSHCRKAIVQTTCFSSASYVLPNEPSLRRTASSAQLGSSADGCQPSS